MHFVEQQQVRHTPYTLACSSLTLYSSTNTEPIALPPSSRAKFDVRISTRTGPILSSIGATHEKQKLLSIGSSLHLLRTRNTHYIQRRTTPRTCLSEQRIYNLDTNIK
ncbi:unnamed protein product [Ectocarpus sp. 6 AP-2014]